MVSVLKTAASFRQCATKSPKKHTVIGSSVRASWQSACPSAYISPEQPPRLPLRSLISQSAALMPPFSQWGGGLSGRAKTTVQ